MNKHFKLIGLLILLVGFVMTTACAKSVGAPDIEETSAAQEEAMAAEAEASTDGFGEQERTEDISLEEMEAGVGVAEGSMAEVFEEPVVEMDEQQEQLDFLQEEDFVAPEVAEVEPEPEPFMEPEPEPEPVIEEFVEESIEEASLESVAMSLDFEDVYFAYDKFDIDDNARDVLRRNAEMLRNNPNARVEIEGHCDSRGTNNYNMALGDRRATAAKNFLLAEGVSEDQVQTISYGEERPFCFDESDDCHYQNRRGHFTALE